MVKSNYSYSHNRHSRNAENRPCVHFRRLEPLLRDRAFHHIRDMGIGSKALKKSNFQKRSRLPTICRWSTSFFYCMLMMSILMIIQCEHFYEWSPTGSLTHQLIPKLSKSLKSLSHRKTPIWKVVYDNSTKWAFFLISGRIPIIRMCSVISNHSVYLVH